MAHLVQCKHFLANSLEHSTIDGKVVTRHNFDAEIPLPELQDYYLPAFKSCVQEGRALGIMCSYNAVNGVPMCANQQLLGGVLRKDWGFDGYVTSDCGAIADITEPHSFAPDGPTAAAMGLKAGCDTDCGGVYGANVATAVNRSILDVSTIDAALRRLVKIQMRLGLFEDKIAQPYFDRSKYGIHQIDNAAHQQLAYEAALQSIVLLKNDKKTLPLKEGLKLALVGPHVNAHEVFMSNYHGARCPSGKYDCIVSPLQALTKANSRGTTTGYEGVEVDSNVDHIAAAVATAKEADAVVLLMGIDGSQEGEEHDRYNCTLPGLQPQLIEQVSALGKPTVLVLIHGGAMCLGPLKDKASAIVDAFYGGEKGALALADVLFGAYNPSGKLPITMYPPEYMYQIPLTQMSVTAPPGRTHMYYSGKPEFAFGSGLSYSQWKMEPVEQVESGSVELRAGGSLEVALRLSNLGPWAGAQRVLAFLRPRLVHGAPVTMAKQRLVGFSGAHLMVGESAKLKFKLEAATLAQSNGAGEHVILPGEYILAFRDGAQEVTLAVRFTGEAP